MYSTKPSLIYGFHGCDRNVAIEILNDPHSFEKSNNNYDWLGDGAYFWENNHQRAVEYANLSMKRPGSSVEEPFAIGAVIDLGNCFDLLDQRYLNFLEVAYTKFKASLIEEGKTLPVNGSFGKDDFDFKKRELDCAVIRYARRIAEKEGEEFDSVRAAFIEGEKVYEGAGFHKNNHIQIAIINPNCIKGVFLPKEKDKSWA